MAKVKERKSESWKPGVFHDDGYISKNKKRKDKRMSLNLSAKKMDTDEFIPIKKSALALGKAKQGSAKFLSPSLDKKQTPKKKDTPSSALPGKNKENTSFTPNPRKLSLAAGGTPKAKPALAGTPKKKVEIVGTPKTVAEPASASKNKSPFVGTPKAKIEPAIKSSLKKKAQKFIDNEAEEGEEPITDKNVKPYEKGQKRKSISFKFDKTDDSDESDDSDSDDELTDARDFFDHEASEGEETDDSNDVEGASDMESGSGEEDSDDDDDDDEEDDEDDDDDDDEENGEDSDLFKSFVDGEEDDDSDEEDSGDDNESDEDDEDDSDEEEEEEEVPKIQEKKKPDNKTKAKPEPAPSAPLNPNKKAKVEKPVKANEVPAKKSEPQTKVVQKDTKPVEKSKEKQALPTSEYSGYIKFLPSAITVDKLKAQLCNEISPENIVSIVLKKNNTKNSNKCLVYVTDEDTLDKLQNKTFTIGPTTFKVYKARESKKLVKTKPLAFLPRVPLSIDSKKIESLIAADVGAENIVKVKCKGVNQKMKTRNILVEFANEEVLKKIIFKGSYTHEGTEIIVRQAFESGFQIPIFKVVFSGLPEKVNETVIKKAVEAKVGQGTVINVKFSFNKRSFAFVSLYTEQAQKKLLQPGTEISIKGTKVEILEFKPRPPKKRSAPKKKTQDGSAAKKQKTEDSSSVAAPTANKSKNKNKPQKPAAQPNSPVAKPQNNAEKPPKQKQQSLKPAQNDAQKSSPKKQKPQKQQKQQQVKPSQSPAVLHEAKNKKAKKAQNENQVPDKKASLSNKLEAKKDKLKDKKMKKKQAKSE